MQYTFNVTQMLVRMDKGIRADVPVSFSVVVEIRYYREGEWASFVYASSDTFRAILRFEGDSVNSFKLLASDDQKHVWLLSPSVDGGASYTVLVTDQIIPHADFYHPPRRLLNQHKPLLGPIRDVAVVTDIEGFISKRFDQLPKNKIIKTRLGTNAQPTKRLGCRPLSVDELKAHLRAHTANADGAGPFILTFWLCQEPLSVFSRAPDSALWK